MEDQSLLRRSSKSASDLGNTHAERMNTLFGEDRESKPFYSKQSFGYIVLIILYLCLGILHTITQYHHEFEHTAHWISIGLYFMASISYMLIFTGHLHEKEHSLNKMIRIAQLHMGDT